MIVSPETDTLPRTYAKGLRPMSQHRDGSSAMLSFDGTLSIQTPIRSSTKRFHKAWTIEQWSKHFAVPKQRKHTRTHIWLKAPADKPRFAAASAPVLSLHTTTFRPTNLSAKALTPYTRSRTPHCKHRNYCRSTDLGRCLEALDP